MKHLKPTNSETNNSPRPPLKINSRAQLRQLQRVMTGALFRPLTSQWGMQKHWIDGAPMKAIASEFIKPNDRLSSFERLEIYNRQYWFRVLDCLYDDYPGLRAVVGERRFLKLVTAYLTKYPSDSYTLRDLGNRLEQFLREEPHWSFPREELALDMVRFEWAQVVAFDGPANPPVTPDDILDTPPSKLQLGLQPYLTLLDLDFAVDDFLIAVKKRESDVLRGEASNAMNGAPKSAVAQKRVRYPKREKVNLAVHRHDNMLYYKRLEQEAFAILTSLSRGTTVEEACVEAVTASKRTNVDWSGQIKAWFDAWSALGWFCRRS
ncbi:MAG: putative DNA-binding domain-containing protein [Verrucomicrobia bacterium]|nr:putative DNA-binding domain-containing protein [Verrucomicrobiota bacterium]